MSLETAFRPGGTITLTATGASSGATINPAFSGVEVQNNGGEVVFMRWGVGAQTATTSDYPILAGQSKSISIGSGNTHVAVITGGGTCTVYVTGGEGL
jgi:hypothetical protein